MEDEEDLATTVLTCEGDISDPAFPSKLQLLVTKLQHLISDEKPIQVTKVEPWNSVRVTFNIPQEAAQRLRQLAERGDRVLRELGILSVQIEGDQVITLTLAGQFNEPHEIILRKASDTRRDVASVSFNLPNSEPEASTSAEPTHKNISQFLGHIVGGAATIAPVAASSSRVERLEVPAKQDASVGFRSPNVIAPSSTEPIPFLLPSVVTTSTAAGTFPSSQSVSSKSLAGFGPFPFASMTHAMNTKHVSTTPPFQSVANAASANQHPTAVHNVLSNSSVALPVTRPKTASSPVFNNIITRVASPNLVAASGRANVALSSPLLVNLLQSETSNLQGHTKLMPPPMIVANATPKRKRKPRKPKDKLQEDNSFSPSNSSTSCSPPLHTAIRTANPPDSPTSMGQPFVTMGSISVSSPTPQISNLHSIIKSHQSVSAMQAQTASIHPQAQGQPAVSLHVRSQGHLTLNPSRKVPGQVISSIHCQPQSVPNIHPQAQGQPQVHTGNLPLHSHIPVVSSQLSRPHTNVVQSYAVSRTVASAASSSRMVLSGKDIGFITKLPDKASRDLTAKASEPPVTSSNSASESNPFPSPPSSGDGKTKHLINPFTGQLEPMPSDDEEEDESIGSLPPFPDFEIETSENGQSERSLSDGGKENYHSSDTDSGISKSHTDISQSSTECGPVQASRDSRSHEAIASVEKISTASVTSSIPGEKLKLRLKLDPKALRESKEAESKEKRLKECNPQSNQKIDVALVNIPGVKKGASVGSSAPEPRVPPLHISLRGPNAAVVVSPKKDDVKSRHLSNKDESSSAEPFIKLPQKKARSPRSIRTSSDSAFSSICLSSRIPDNNTDKRSRSNSGKDSSKKSKDDMWSPNAKNMSGGGIIEMSDKAPHCFVPMGSTGTPRKNSQEACKSDVITLTSCATGESVSIHTAANSRSPLPFHLMMSPERDNMASSSAESIQQRQKLASASSNVQAVESKSEKNTKSVLHNDNRHEAQENSLDKCKVNLLSQKDDCLGRHSQIMQKNHLPHSLSGHADKCRNSSVLESDFSRDLNTQVSTNCIPTTSVPPSSQSLCFVTTPCCTPSETTTNVASVDQMVNIITDANKHVPKEKDSAISLSRTCTLTDNINNQCNIRSVNATMEVSENASSPVLSISVQNDLAVLPASSEASQADQVKGNEVQNAPAVNREQTANNVDTHVNYGSDCNEVIANSVVNSVTPVENHDQCNKNDAFSNFIDVCKPPLASIMSIAKREIIKDVIDSPDKGLHLIELKKPPLAQIITVDNLPIQSHVIEVPSLTTSLSMQRSAVKSDLANIEVSSIPSLIPSYGGAFLPTRSSAVLLQNSRTSSSFGDSGRDSPKFSQTARHNSPCQEGFPKTDRLQKPDDAPKKLGNEEKLGKSLKAEEENVGEQNSPTVVSEESSMDSIDEERKKCMLTSEGKSSTPGPPIEAKIVESDQAMSSIPQKEKPQKEKQSVVQQTTSVSNVNLSLKDEAIKNEGPSQKFNHLSCSDEVPASKDPEPSLAEKVLLIGKEKMDVCKGEQSKLSSILLSNHSISSVDPANSSCSSDLPKTAFVVPPKSEEASSSNRTSSCTDTAKNEPQSTLLVAQSSLHSDTLLTLASTSDQRPKCIPSTEAISVVCSTSNSVVTSLLSHGRFLSPEVSAGGRVRLIFKGSTQHSMLTNCNSPASVVLPINSAKTVPIKLVTLPGGAAGLSVRSTSNPKVVEIIGSSKSPVQSSPLTGGHPPSPVRLVVSKVAPSASATGASQNSGASLRNRVVVKSVVVTGGSPSLKLVSSAKSNAPFSSSVSVSSSASDTTLSVSKKLPVSAATIDSTTSVSQILAQKSEQTDSNLISSISSNHEETKNPQQYKVENAETNPISTPVSSTTQTSNSVTVRCQSPREPSRTSLKSPSPALTSSQRVSLSELKPDSSKRSTGDCSNRSLCTSQVTESAPMKSNQDALVSQSDTILSSSQTNSLTLKLLDNTNTDNLCKEQDRVTNVSNKVSSSNESDSQKAQPQKATACEATPTSVSSEIDCNEKSTIGKPIVLSSSYTSASTQEQVPDASETVKKCNTDHCDEFLMDQAFLLSNAVEVCVNPEVVIKTEDIVNDSIETCKQKVKEIIRPIKKEPKTEEIPSSACIDGSGGESEESDSSRGEVKSQSLVHSKKPVKRKCSENAAELIKACMGVEDGPKRGLPPPKPKPVEETAEKPEPEDNVRMSLRLRKDDSSKKSKGSFQSDCSSGDEELPTNEMVNKTCVREQRSTRSRVANRDNLADQLNCRIGRQRSGSNESQKSEDLKIKGRESKRDTKKEEVLKKVPERTKRGVLKVPGVQRSINVKDHEVKSNVVNAKEEVNAKRKTRSTGNTEMVEAVPAKRRRYSKDGHR